MSVTPVMPSDSAGVLSYVSIFARTPIIDIMQLFSKRHKTRRNRAATFDTFA